MTNAVQEAAGAVAPEFSSRNDHVVNFLRSAVSEFVDIGTVEIDDSDGKNGRLSQPSWTVRGVPPQHQQAFFAAVRELTNAFIFDYGDKSRVTGLSFDVFPDAPSIVYVHLRYYSGHNAIENPRAVDWRRDERADTIPEPQSPSLCSSWEFEEVKSKQEEYMCEYAHEPGVHCNLCQLIPAVSAAEKPKKEPVVGWAASAAGKELGKMIAKKVGEKTGYGVRSHNGNYSSRIHTVGGQFVKGIPLPIYTNPTIERIQTHGLMNHHRNKNGLYNGGSFLSLGAKGGSFLSP